MPYHVLAPVWKHLLEIALREDGAAWDWTTMAVSGSARAKKVHAKITAKSEGIWAAEPLTAVLNAVAHENFIGGHFLAKSLIRDGSALKKGMVVAEWSGSAQSVLALERSYLNLASYVSGIATQTHELVSIVGKACPKETPRVTATRKILPAYRDLAIHGLHAGGGNSHRLNLASGVLIKENHIMVAGGIQKAIEGARKAAPHALRIEVEVRNEKELAEALSAEADIIMLDNFKPQDVKKALKTISQAKRRPILEVSGGLNAQTIADYALPGVDVLSVGYLTHSVKSLDLSLLISE